LIGDNVIVHPGHASANPVPIAAMPALPLPARASQGAGDWPGHYSKRCRSRRQRHIDRGAAGDTVIGKKHESAISRGSRKMPRLDAIASSPRKLAYPPACDSKILPALELDLKIADQFPIPACSNSLTLSDSFSIT